ncbi:hypothetical protein Tco_0418008 [Tanacetum coccineum]
MRTRPSSNLVGESSTNPTTLNPKRHNRRRSNKPFSLKESPLDTMADQHTMAELLRAPTEGYVEAIVVPPILAEHFELKHSLINMMTSDQFFGLEKDNPYDHIHLLRKCPHHGFTELHQLDTFNNALNPADQDSLNSAAGGNLLKRRTQDVLMIIENKSKVCNSRNKSIVSQVKSSDVNSSSSEIAKLTHAVNQQTSAVTTAMTAILKQFQATPPPASVKAVEEICVTCGGAHPYYQCLAADGNTFPEFQDNIQGYVSAAAVNYNQGNSGYRPPSVANQIRPPGFAQPNVQNNQNRFSQPQGYNRGNNFKQDTSYQAPIQQNQVVPLSELEKIKKINEVNIKAMQAQINNVKNELRNEMQTSIQASMSNQTNELKNMMASFFQMNTPSTSGSGSLPSNTIANPKGELKAITTRSGLVLDGPSVPMPPPFINPEEDERVEETLTDPELAEYTIKVPPPLVQKAKLTSSCGNGAHYGYNCPLKVPIISNPEPCNNQTVDELPQTLPCFDPTCYSGDGNSFTYDSTPNFVNDSSNYTVNHPIFNAQNELLNSQNEIMEQMTSICDMIGQYMHKKEEEKRITKEQAAKNRYWKIPICYDDDDEEESSIPLRDIIIFGLPPCVAIILVLSTKPVDSLIMEDEHLDTISAIESDEVIKSSVENLVPIPSDSEGIPDNICDVPFRDNSPPLNILKEQFEDFSDSIDDSTSIDDDSFSIDDIEYVEASPPNSELVSLEVVEIVIPEVGGIDTDILLTIKDDILHEKLLNINLLIAKIEALKDNPTPSSNFVTNSGSPTSYSDLSLPDYEAFFRDSKPDSRDFNMDVVEVICDNPTREPRVHVLNVLPTHPTLHLDLDFILSIDSLVAYVVWIFLPFLTYPITLPYLLSFRNEDIIFDPGIFVYQYFMPSVSHWSGTFMKFNAYPNNLNESSMEILSSTCSPMDQ